MSRPSCLSHRLRQWLSFGSDLVAPQLHRLKYPCLVVAGTVDNLLPSYEEAQRLEKELPDCQVRCCWFFLGGGWVVKWVGVCD